MDCKLGVLPTCVDVQLTTNWILQRGVFVAGLREEIVDSVEQVLGLLESGEGMLINCVAVFSLRMMFSYCSTLSDKIMNTFMSHPVGVSLGISFDIDFTQYWCSTAAFWRDKHEYVQ